ncbi:bifunctional DNA primase/polymerase-like protein [Leucobacter komagatae]|uniref:Bifunctional DNA primase/polymerase-like protein n=1 Tax=Leucobacter komagatae TaxID=55969 RepID=A0A542Y4H4_9MICO|nr:bifunctional DNA primase/polymerase [Leucobacter komagatae]TQL42976.1 bifunctional DNA primase/polymerase-like protein [Leucobacter komagatae]
MMSASNQIPEVTNERGFLDAALWYAAAGYRVHPLRPASKRPILEEWQNAASSERSEVADWWSGQHKGRNIGVVTGEANRLLVIDVDAKNGVNGMASLSEWERASSIQLPESPIVLTPSGGRHLWFRLDQSCKSPVGWLPGVDVRADGGYVAAAPSMVWNSFQDSSMSKSEPYAAFYALTKGALNSLPLAPEALVAAINRDGGRFHANAGNDGSRIAGKNLPHLSEFLKEGFKPGQRDNDCYRLACSLWRQFWGDDDTVEYLIREVWERTPQVPDEFTWREAFAKLNGARAYVAQQINAEQAAAARMMGGHQ